MYEERIRLLEDELAGVRAEKARRERVIRMYQRRARAAVKVLRRHDLALEYLEAHNELERAEGE